MTCLFVVQRFFTNVSYVPLMVLRTLPPIIYVRLMIMRKKLDTEAGIDCTIISNADNIIVFFFSVQIPAISATFMKYIKK